MNRYEAALVVAAACAPEIPPMWAAAFYEALVRRVEHREAERRWAAGDCFRKGCRNRSKVERLAPYVGIIKLCYPHERELDAALEAAKARATLTGQNFEDLLIASQGA